MCPQSSPPTWKDRVDYIFLITLISLLGAGALTLLGVEDMVDKRDAILRKNAVRRYQEDLVHRGVARWKAHPRTGTTTLVVCEEE